MKATGLVEGLIISHKLGIKNKNWTYEIEVMAKSPKREKEIIEVQFYTV